MTFSRSLPIWLIGIAALTGSSTNLYAESVPAAYRTIATERGIPHSIFYAVALAESGKQVVTAGVFRPWPWTLNVGGQGYYFDSKQDAWQALKDWLQTGRRSIDIGLMILVHALVTKKDVLKQDSMLRCRSGLLIDRVRRCV